MTARVLVTGGAGFIGSHVVREVLGTGRPVTVLDNFVTGHRGNLQGVSGDLRVLEGSVTDAAALRRALEDVRAVVHLAALPSVSRSLEAPRESHEACATGTLMVLDAARAQRLRVVYAGSSSAYGDQAAASKHEELRESPLSPYAAAKLAGELYCRTFARCFGLTVVVLRLFNVFGPRQVPDSPYSGVVAAFCHALLHGTRPRIDGDGTQSRDFTYVADVALGFRLAVERELPAGCHLANFACGQSHSVNELLATLGRIAGRTAQPIHAAARTGDVRHSLADVSRARELLGDSPRTTFEEGLRHTWSWYLENHRTNQPQIHP